MIFSVPIEKEVTRTDEYEEEIPNTILYKLQFVDSAGFMVSLLSSPVIIILLKEFMKLSF